MADVDRDEFGIAAAWAIRTTTTPLRLTIIGAIAVLLYVVGRWSFALPWFLAYAVLQALLLLRYDLQRRFLGLNAIEVISTASYAVAGLPTWHLWTRCGDLGIAASTMFLCGMLVQLVVGSLGARRLFWCSATPLIAYLIVVPPLAIGAPRFVEGLAAAACGTFLVAYMGALWGGHQRALEEMKQSRARAVELTLEAQAANRAKTDFLAVMSHEIRTPMNAVLGASDLLGRSRLDDQQRAHVAMISSAGSVLMHVLNDVLDLAKIEAGKLLIEPTNVDLHSLVRQCVEISAAAASEKGLDFQLEIDASAPQFVVLDAARTGQILFNLLSNALKFTERGGVAIRLEAASLAAAEAEIRISVRDSGCGIPQEALGRLFDAFEQADGSISRRFGGTGLGLAISQRLAGMLGGAVTVESTLGEGTTFRVSLRAPIGQRPAVDASPQGAEEASLVGRSLRILAAEDHPTNQRIIELFLAPLGADLTIVANGREALEALGVSRFDIVLMDMQMPEMDGLEATRRLRSSAGLNASVPVLALTANVMASERQACLEAGMNGHIAKPIDSRSLLASILSALQHAEIEAPLAQACEA